jgi:hypothetical protein
MGGLLVPSQAAATNYYYGIAVLNGSSFLGTDLSMRVDCLYDPESLTTDGSHVDQDSWMGDNNGNWVEAGIMQGSSGGGSGVFARVPAFFWGDKRPNSVFYIHLGSAATLGSYYDDSIRNGGTERWNVDIGGFTGSSYPNFATAQGIETGLEETDQNSTAYGSSSSMGYYDSDNNWHAGWSDSSGNASISDANSPYPYAYWVSQDNWIRDYNGSDSCSDASTASTQPPSATGLSPASLAAIASGMAAATGESTPAAIQSVETTRADAVYAASQGDTISSSEEVFLISMEGHFTASSVPRPPGAPAPTGTVLTAVVDASTGQVTDWGLSANAPDLTALGAVTALN